MRQYSYTSDRKNSAPPYNDKDKKKTNVTFCYYRNKIDLFLLVILVENPAPLLSAQGWH